MYRSTDIGWRRRARLARRKPGRVAGSIASQAAAAAPRSLSEKDSSTRSAGVWPRSAAGSSASSDRVSRTSRCNGSARPGAGDRGRDGIAVQPGAADHDQPAVARLPVAPRAVELLPEPGADALDQQAHALAADGREALHP